MNIYYVICLKDKCNFILFLILYFQKPTSLCKNTIYAENYSMIIIKIVIWLRLYKDFFEYITLPINNSISTINWLVSSFQMWRGEKPNDNREKTCKINVIMVYIAVFSARCPETQYMIN